MNIQLQQALEILLDKDYPNIGERDDIAMDLESFDEPEVLYALIKVASDPEEKHMILASAGESIGDIMARTNNINIEALRKLVPVAKREALSAIALHNPKLFQKYHLQDLK